MPVVGATPFHSYQKGIQQQQQPERNETNETDLFLPSPLLSSPASAASAASIDPWISSKSPFFVFLSFVGRRCVCVLIFINWNFTKWNEGFMSGGSFVVWSIDGRERKKTDFLQSLCRLKSWKICLFLLCFQTNSSSRIFHWMMEGGKWCKKYTVRVCVLMASTSPHNPAESIKDINAWERENEWKIEVALSSSASHRHIHTHKVHQTHEGKKSRKKKELFADGHHRIDCRERI